MCYFANSPLLSEESVAIDDAIVAWKALRLNDLGLLRSPVQSTNWSPQAPLYASRAPSHRSSTGIYTFETSTAAHCHGSDQQGVVVQLLLWGKVLHYGATASKKAGYLAQRAEIHEIRLPSGLYVRLGGHVHGGTDVAVGRLVDIWRGHGVRIVRQRGRTREVLLRGDEPMPVAA